MDSSEIAIKVDAVSKDFTLPHQRANTVKSLFVNNPFKRRLKNSTEVQHALNNISFEVKKGEFFGIVGRNGSGKSTLLKMLAGIYQPTKGKIAINGRLVPFIELGVGFNPELTGRENVYLNGALLGFSQKEVAAKYRSIVDFAELDRFMDQKLKNYSSGMQVRLAFSVATILAESDILLIDEVLAVGDADFQRKCFDYFKKLKNDNKTVVFVSHDMDAIRTYCDRAVLINDSKLVYSGRAEEVSKEYTKLFNQDKDGGSASETGNVRWGTNEARIENISIKVGPSEILVTETLEARTDVDGCIVGFRIANSMQEGVTGTNTKLERHPIGPLVKGERVKLCWKLPNIFSSGEYTFDTTVHSVDLATIYDWWEGGKSFKVKNNRDLPYYSVDPEFSLEVVRDNS